MPDIYEDYRAACVRATTDAGFATFKTDPAYTKILEHVAKRFVAPYWEGIVRQETAHGIRVPWDAVKRNDAIGGPHTVQVNGMKVSPTLLRYVCLGMDILNHARATTTGQNLRIVEIGGGYGGQAFVLACLAPLYGLRIRSYVMYDLPEATALQKRVLRQLAPSLPVTWPPLTQATDMAPGQFLVSNYALGELPEKLQRAYCHALGRAVAHGYMVWNTPTVPPCVQQTIAQAGLKEQPEVPLTGKHNRILLW